MTASGSNPNLDQLTSRQREVLLLLVKGLTTNQIAQKLELSPYTVKTHTGAILQILNSD